MRYCVWCRKYVDSRYFVEEIRCGLTLEQAERYQRKMQQQHYVCDITPESELKR